MAPGKALDGKPYAGNPHVRFEEGASAREKPRRKALLHRKKLLAVCILICLQASTFACCAAEEAARAGSPVTVRVAAVNSTEADKAAADFVCTWNGRIWVDAMGNPAPDNTADEKR